MENEQARDGWERLDWNTAEVRSMVAGGWRLFVAGVAPVPMEVELRVLPVGRAPEDRRGVVVEGKRGDFGPEVETPWNESLDVSQLGPFVLIGKTKRETFLPSE